MLERARAHEKIQFLPDTVVEEVHDVAKKEVTGLTIRNVVSGKKSLLPSSAMFLGIGHEPNAKWVNGQLETDKDGYLITHSYVFTKVPGVYACGDVQDRRYRQAISAAGTGCMAAMEAEKFLEEHGR
jgi:thioredoxin reductase (NADPH)